MTAELGKGDGSGDFMERMSETDLKVELISIQKVIHSASVDIRRLRETLRSVPAEAIFTEINKLDLTETEQAALRVLLK